MEIRILTKIALLIFIYYVVYAFVSGVIQPIPALGDSWDYHIPIEQSILHGTFMTLSHVKLPQWYYPGSAEAINALFLFLHIPLTLSNLFAIIILFFVLWKLAYDFTLPYYYSLLFALTFCSLNVIVRWFNAVSIDIWVAIFFSLALMVIRSPQKNWKYFAKLGFILGMLVGSKYTACLFVVVLLCVYAKRVYAILTLPRFVSFFVPFSIFGLFWYIRNYFLMHNPFYPLPVLGFSGKELFTQSIFSVSLHFPFQMINALFGEYKLWSLLLLFPVFLFMYLPFFAKKYSLPQTDTIGQIKILLLIGLLNFLLFLQLPTSNQPWIMTSSFRYSYPVFIPLLLACFLLIRIYKKEVLLAYVAIGNMLLVTSFTYLPKLTLLYIPLAFLSFYFLDKYNPQQKLRTRRLP